MSATLLSANRRYMADLPGIGLPVRPALQMAILSCMDARYDPARILGLSEGDAHIIRNAGGRVSDDAIRSLAVSQQLFGTREIVIVHHTDCERTQVAPDSFRARLREELGADASSIDLMAFDNLERSVHDDMRALRHSPLLRSVPVRGYIYDVATGEVTEVR
jgi:carbonic anhydrase